MQHNERLMSGGSIANKTAAPRIYCSESQRALIWERWCRGGLLQHIAQLFNHMEFWCKLEECNLSDAGDRDDRCLDASRR